VEQENTSAIRMKYSIWWFLVNSGSVVGLGVASLLLAGSKLLDQVLLLGDHSFITGASVLVYAYHKLNRPEVPRYQAYSGIVLGLLLSLSIFLMESNILIYKVIIPGLITLNYIGLFKFSKSSIRNNLWMKHISVALVWAWILMLPFTYKEWTAILTSLLYFSMIIQLSLIFDIKDSSYDKIKSRSNLLEKVSLKKVKLLSKLFHFFALVLIVILYGIFKVNSIITFSIIFTLMAQSALVQFSNTSRSDLYYYLGLDGTLILPGFLYVAFLFLLLI